MLLRSLVLIGLGGGIGSMLRYLTSLWVGRCFPHHFPLATFVVNMAGCLLIGVLFGLFERHVPSTTGLRAFFMTGFCGGFTTFSTFALENVNLLQSGHAWLAFAYVAASVVIGLLLVWLGISMVK